jgi:diguanylate cyclase (GGDEF)-like protein
MLVQLVWVACLEPSRGWTHHDTPRVDGPDGRTRLEREIHESRIEAISQIIGAGAGVDLRLAHRGRVRISELRDALRTGRIRDPMGILFDGRHADRALRIAVIDAGPERPLTVAYLDLNGMKEANDTLGHAAGDVLVRAYLSAVDAGVEDMGEAFRIGGDEVLVILPGQDLAAGERVVRRAHRLFASERLTHNGKELPARSLCAGLVEVRDPVKVASEVRDNADAEMLRAKSESKKVPGGTPRPSLLALQERPDVIDLGAEDAGKLDGDEAALRASLARHRGNVKRVAEDLGVTRQQVYRLAERLGLDLDTFR